MRTIIAIAFLAYLLMNVPCFAQTALIARDDLISDARQLADIIENVHPDPYINGGGKIAFHKRLHRVLNAIPNEGMAAADFYALMAPFVASIGDAHTRINFPPVSSDIDRGIPFGFRCFDSCLYIRTVVGEQYADLLGARLEAVEGVSFEQLVERAGKTIGTENLFNLIDNLRFPLWDGSQLQYLVPEWSGGDSIQLALRMPDDSLRDITVAAFREPGVGHYISDSKFEKPSASRADFNWEFIDEARTAALMVVANMSNYREALERRDNLGVSPEANERRARRAYKRYHETEPPESYLDVRNGVPSVTEMFLDMLVQMKSANTELLIVDLRGNVGGSSSMSTILTYFLHGVDTYLDMHQPLVELRKYSHYYFESHKDVTLESLNKDRPVPLLENDYLFATNDPEVFDVDETTLRADLRRQFQDAAEAMPTFGKVYATGEYEAYFCPEKVVVLCDASTFSSAFTMMKSLRNSGAVLLGTPSGQASNVFGSLMNFKLNNSELSGYVSQMRFEDISLDDEAAKRMMPDYVMSYEQLAAYEFDPNAEILWALDLFGPQRVD